MFLNRFDVLMLKIIFFLKYYFDVFLSEKHFKNNHYYTPKYLLVI